MTSKPEVKGPTVTLLFGDDPDIEHAAHRFRQAGDLLAKGAFTTEIR